MDKTEARAILAQNNLNSNPTPRAGFVQNGPKQQMQVTDSGNTFLFSSGGVLLHRCDIFYVPQHRPTKRGAVCKSGDGRGLLSKYHCVSNFDATQKENPRIIVKEKSK